MIEIKRISEVRRGMQDEAYAIVRSMRTPSDWLVQLPVLSPSRELFFEYRRMAQNGTWGRETFEKVYVPRFLREMTSEAARSELNRLFQLDRAGRHVTLCCFCTDESLCHRSIVAGLLQGAGAHVVLPSGADYSRYWEQYKALG